MFLAPFSGSRCITEEFSYGPQFMLQLEKDYIISELLI
jgi:hypothetical protein